MFIVPGIADLFLVDFSGRQERLGILSIDHVPIYVYIIERVVLTDTLSLIIESLRRSIVVDTDVGNGICVVGNVLAGQILIGFKPFHIHIVESIRRLGILDIAFQIFAFFIDFIRCYHQVLYHQCTAHADSSYDEHGDRCDHCRFEFFLRDADGKSDSCQNRQSHDDPVNPKRNLYIGKACTVYSACASKQQIVLLEEEIHADHQEEQHSYDDELLLRDGDQKS